MRYPAQLTRERHERILDEAGRLFRQQGLDKTGVAEIMKAANLTHGGFYAHFDSKESLAAEATARCVAEVDSLVRKAADSAGENVIPHLAAQYLTPAHRDNPGSGCGIAALAPDMARQPEPVRTAFTAELQNVLSTLGSRVNRASPEAGRAEAIQTFASFVGALLLARAVSDPHLSDEILAAVRDKAVSPS